MAPQRRCCPPERGQHTESSLAKKCGMYVCVRGRTFLEWLAMKSIQRSTFTVLAGLAFAGCAYAWICNGQTHHASDTPSAERLDVASPMLTAAPQRPGADAAHMHIDFRSGLLTVKADGVPLSEVLAAIADSAGVRFTPYAGVTDLISLDAGPGPLRTVIAQVLDRSGYGYAYLDSGPAREGTLRAHVFLFKRGEAGAATATQRSPMPSSNVTEPAFATPAARDAALQQQRAVDALFDACKAQACDTS